MINFIQSLWKQLNGPQITAVFRAIYDFIKEAFDDTMNYLNTLSIETATSEHLTFIGSLMGIPRPIISLFERAFFFFTEAPEHNSNNGFSSLDDIYVGGQFTAKDYEPLYDIIPESIFRIILKTASLSEGEFGSLIFLDDLLYAIRLYDNLQPDYLYNISFIQDNNNTFDLTYGDIMIYLGKTKSWRNISSCEALLQALAETMYTPVPRILYALLYHTDT